MESLKRKSSWLGRTIWLGLLSCAILWFYPDAPTKVMERSGSAALAATPIGPLKSDPPPEASPNSALSSAEADATEQGSAVGKPSGRLRVGHLPQQRIGSSAHRQKRDDRPHQDVWAPKAPATPPVQTPPTGPRVDAAPAYPKAASKNLPQPELAFQVPQQLPALDPLPAAIQATAQIQQQMARGNLDIQFVGTGSGPQMVFLELLNRGSKPLQVDLRPGMVLRPGQAKVQPLLVRDSCQLTLRPGESQGLSLETYCMDSRIPAPAQGAKVDYRWSDPRHGENAGVVAFLQHFEQSLVQDQLGPVWGQSALRSLGCPDEVYSRAVLQIGVWTTLGQPVADKQWRSVLGPYAQSGEIRRAVTADVARIRAGTRKQASPDGPRPHP